MAKFGAKEQGGGRGILNLLGGIGRESRAMSEADIERMNKQRAMEREQDIFQAKMLNEIDAARRAEARGDVKSQVEHEQNIAKLKSDFQASRVSQFGKAAELFEGRRHNLTDEDLKRLQLQQQAAQNAKMGISGIEQVFNFVQKQFPSLPREQQLDLAKSLTTAGIGAEGRLDAETLKKVADVNKRYGMLIAGAKDEAVKKRFTDQRDEEIRQLTGKVSGGGAGVSTAGFGEPQRVK
jgi:hypothetical protein